MEEWEFQLKRALNGEIPAENGKMESLRSEIVRAYERKERRMRYQFYGWMTFFAVLMAISAWQFWASSDLKLVVWNGIIFLLMFEGTILMKVWYFVGEAKITSLREVKQLQVQVAELASRMAGKESQKL